VYEEKGTFRETTLHPSSAPGLGLEMKTHDPV